MGTRQPFTLLLIVVLISSMHSAASPEVNTSKTLPLNFQNSYEKNWDYQKSFQPEMPNATKYLDNQLSDFTPAGTTVYTGTDVVPEYSRPWYYVNVSLTNIYVVNDRDGVGGAGDIYIKGGMNSFSNRYPSSGNWQINSGEYRALDIGLISGWVINLGFTFGVRDIDPLQPDDSLGDINVHLTQYENTSFWVYTDSGYAALYFNVTILAIDTNVTANQIVNLYKPKMYVDDETTHTEMPDNVYGRVIAGNDNGIDALVIQYIFYWNAEYAPDLLGGFKTHDNDYEIFLVYLNQSDPLMPYRIVFNNWWYSDVFTDAPSTSIAIFEDSAVTGKYSYNVTINPDLQGFLGTNVTLDATVHDMSEISNWEYALGFNTNAFTYQPNGVITVELTVETSYHTFDLGPIFLSGSSYGFNYPVDDLKDSVIKDMYSGIEDTFNAGVHFWSAFGIDVPLVAPFSFDITNVFTRPYAINAYANVIDDAAAITKAKNTQLNIDVSGKIGVGIEVPTELSVSYPETVSSDTISVTFDLNPQATNTEITLQYSLYANISFVFWFLSGSILLNHSGSVTFQPFSNRTQFIAGALGLGEYHSEDTKILNYLTGDISMNPTFLGTIVDGSLNLDVLGMVNEVYSANPLVRTIMTLVEFIVKDLNITVKASLFTSIHQSLSTNIEGLILSSDTLVFGDETSQTIQVTIPKDVNLGKEIVLFLSDAQYIVNFTMDWGLEMGMKYPVSMVIQDFSTTMFTYPDFSATALTAAGGNVTIPVPQKNSGGFVDGPTIPLVGISMITIAILTKNTKRR